MTKLIPDAAAGPLTAHPANPRYFADAHGEAVYLVGSHTWANFQDVGFEGGKPFDYDEYLDFMVAHRFNFMRLWNWEHAAWATWTPEKLIFGPMPYRRIGPGLALDGKPKFDLEQFDEAYFDRMRARTIQARERGIYVAVMLFQGFSCALPEFNSENSNDVFRGHYYNPDNNIQGFNGDRDGNRILDLNDPDVRRYQTAYIRKIVDTVCDLDNIVYETVNEGGNPGWNDFVIETIRERESSKGKRHPIGVTGHGGVGLDYMLKSGCDWISPGPFEGAEFTNVMDDPPSWDGRKVSILDTDHIWGHGIDYRWVWRSFLRGHNVIFMDPWNPLAGMSETGRNSLDYPGYWDARKAMRNTAYYADRLDLASTMPRNDLASGGFCLANPGREYLIYLRDDHDATVDLSAGEYSVEWMHPVEGTIVAGEDIAGGRSVTVRAEFAGDAVLYIKRQ